MMVKATDRWIKADVKHFFVCVINSKINSNNEEAIYGAGES